MQAHGSSQNFREYKTERHGLFPSSRRSIYVNFILDIDYYFVYAVTRRKNGVQKAHENAKRLE